ncbi:unnamed protein product, partial [Amoebophrya sp. A120]|eukprot:GSA120T00023305001.1
MWTEDGQKFMDELKGKFADRDRSDDRALEKFMEVCPHKDFRPFFAFPKESKMLQAEFQKYDDNVRRKTSW